MKIKQILLVAALVLSGITTLSFAGASSVMAAADCKAGSYSGCKSEADCKKAGGYPVNKASGLQDYQQCLPPGNDCRTGVFAGCKSESDCRSVNGFWDDKKSTCSNPSNATGLQCTVLPQNICNDADQSTLEKSGTWDILKLVLTILNIGVGIVAVGALGFAGFLYATAMDNSENIKKAKNMIRDTIVGLVLYGLMYVALEFLVPGGVFK